MIALIINHFPALYDFTHTKTTEDAAPEIDAWFHFVTGAGTAALAFIAWMKVGHIDKQNEGSFLLHIDEIWRSSESIRARVIIHDLYLQAREKNKEPLEGLSPECQDKLIQCWVGKKIDELGSDPERKEDFIHLLNFLDFMETIGYLSVKDYVTSNELDALCGESLVFSYNIFKYYIDRKRSRHNNDGFYENFDKLYNKLMEHSSQAQQFGLNNASLYPISTP